mgnify:CR=1 FL=1
MQAHDVLWFQKPPGQPQEPPVVLFGIWRYGSAVSVIGCGASGSRHTRSSPAAGQRFDPGLAVTGVEQEAQQFAAKLTGAKSPA